MIKFSYNLFKIILKLGIHSLKKNEDFRLKNINGYILGDKHENIIVDIDMTLLSLYNMFLFIQNLIKKNGKILFIEKYFSFSKIIKLLAEKNLQSFIGEDFWAGGALSNFKWFRWYYYLRNVNIGSKLPDLVIIFDPSKSEDILREVSARNLNIFTPLSFNRLDNYIDYYVVGNYSNFNTVCFLTKMLDLSISCARLDKIKLNKFLMPSDTRVIVKKKKRRKFRKKRGRFIRAFKWNIIRKNKFRLEIKKYAYRYRLIRNIFSKYYNTTRRKAGNPRVLKRKTKLKQVNKRTTNYLQNFLGYYEKRLISVLYKLKLCKDRRIAKKLVENNLVFVNNFNSKGKNFNIKNNDIIQINFFNFRKRQAHVVLRKILKRKLKKRFDWRIKKYRSPYFLINRIKWDTKCLFNSKMRKQTNILPIKKPIFERRSLFNFLKSTKFRSKFFFKKRMLKKRKQFRLGRVIKNIKKVRILKKTPVLCKYLTNNKPKVLPHLYLYNIKKLIKGLSNKYKKKRKWCWRLYKKPWYKVRRLGKRKVWLTLKQTLKKLKYKKKRRKFSTRLAVIRTKLQKWGVRDFWYDYKKHLSKINQQFDLLQKKNSYLNFKNLKTVIKLKQRLKFRLNRRKFKQRQLYRFIWRSLHNTKVSQDFNKKKTFIEKLKKKKIIKFDLSSLNKKSSLHLIKNWKPFYFYKIKMKAKKKHKKTKVISNLIKSWKLRIRLIKKSKIKITKKNKKWVKFMTSLTKNLSKKSFFKKIDFKLKKKQPLKKKKSFKSGMFLWKQIKNFNRIQNRKTMVIFNKNNRNFRKLGRVFGIGIYQVKNIIKKQQFNSLIGIQSLRIKQFKIKLFVRKLVKRKLLLSKQLRSKLLKKVQLETIKKKLLKIAQLKKKQLNNLLLQINKIKQLKFKLFKRRLLLSKQLKSKLLKKEQLKILKSELVKIAQLKKKQLNNFLLKINKIKQLKIKLFKIKLFKIKFLRSVLWEKDQLKIKILKKKLVKIAQLRKKQANNWQFKQKKIKNLRLNNNKIKQLKFKVLPRGQLINALLNKKQSDKWPLKKKQLNKKQSDKWPLKKKQLNRKQSDKWPLKKKQLNRKQSDKWPLKKKQLNRKQSDKWPLKKKQLNRKQSDKWPLKKKQLNRKQSDKWPLNKKRLNIKQSNNWPLNKKRLNIKQSNNWSLKKKQLKNHRFNRKIKGSFRNRNLKRKLFRNGLKKRKVWGRKVWWRRLWQWGKTNTKLVKKIRKRKLKKKAYPRNFIVSKKYGLVTYLYTPKTNKVLLGKFLTIKRLKLISTN